MGFQSSTAGNHRQRQQPAIVLCSSLEAPPEKDMSLEDLPPEACKTLYLTNLPPDITKREVSHILRPFEGFQVCSPAAPINIAHQHLRSLRATTSVFS